MTAAEQKRQSRERIERAELLEHFVKTIKASGHVSLRRMRQSLATIKLAAPVLTLQQWRDIAKVYEITDRTGRSPVEGQTGTRAEKSLWERLENAKAKPWVNDITSLERAEEEIFHAAIIRRMFSGEEVNEEAIYDPDGMERDQTLTCLCGFRCAHWWEAMKHVNESLRGSAKQVRFEELVREVSESTPGYAITLQDAVKARDQHQMAYATVLRWMRQGYFSDISRNEDK